MTHTPISPSLRVTAAKSPTTLAHQLFRFSVGLVLAIVIASVCAAISVPAALSQTVTFAGTGAVNFGTANVCAFDHTTPAPCNNKLTLTYNVTASGTLGTPRALVFGAPYLDYLLATGSTCIGSVTQGNTCTVNVTFAPTVPGQRNGAIEIVDTSGNVLATTYVYGSAVGPLPGFGPPALSPLTTIGTNISSIAVDGDGNVFAAAEPACSTGNLVEIEAINQTILPDSVIRCISLPNSFYPTFMALDGAGNLFGAGGTTIVEIPAAGNYTTLKTISTSFTELGAIRVDGSGNIFAIEQGSYPVLPAVKELLAADGYATPVTLGGTFAPYSAIDLALDSNENVFVSEGNVIKEILAASGYSTVETIQVGNNQNEGPSGIAIDSANNLFVGFASSVGEFFAVDGVLPTDPAGVYIPINSGQVTMVALSGRGNVYASNWNYNQGVFTGTVQQLEFYTPPTVKFATTAVGQTSADSPKSIQLQNRGNATLALSSLTINSIWALVPGSGTPVDCTASSSLVVAAECNLSISFKPTDIGNLVGDIEVMDNAAPFVQFIVLAGTGTAALEIETVSSTYGAPGAIITFNGTAFGATQGSSTITFSGIVAPVLSWSNTSITVTVPYRATTGNVVVTVGDQTSNAVPFTVEATPSVTGISPDSGPVGTLVTISGQNLLDAQGHGTVYLYDTQLPIVSQSSTSLQVRIPTGAVTGVFDVHVNGVGLFTPVFTVPGSPANPHITSLSQNYGALYAVISLTGTGFGAAQGPSRVTFNGVPSTVYGWNNTSITLTVPYRATTGNVVVTVAGQSSNAIPFTVQPMPSITGISPTSGPAGTKVTITGENLLDAEGPGLVWMGELELPILSQSATTLQVAIPAAAATNPILVHVNGVGVFTPVFTVTPSP